MRFSQRRADAEESDTSAKGGVPPRWKEWLDSVHGGGKKKVSNPSPLTKDKYKEVSFSTALKDKNFFRHALKEYYAWAKKSQGKEESKEKPSPSKKGLSLSGPLKVSDKELDSIISKHKEEFDGIIEDMKGEIASYTKSFKKPFRGEDVPEYALSEFESLSEKEKMVHISGQWVGELFEKTLSKDDKELHEAFTKGWTSSSSNPTSMQVHGALSALGVQGYQTSKDKELTDYREAGGKKAYLKDYLGKAYAFSQAFYKHLGLKEITLFRGIMDPALEKAALGDEAEVQTRELSSFSSDPRVAARFGRPLKMKVPVENILWSNVNAKGLAGQTPPGIGESELAVMGASSLTGKVIGNTGKLFDVEGR